MVLLRGAVEPAVAEMVEEQPHLEAAARTISEEEAAAAVMVLMAVMAAMVL
jgi:hypothetical protein